MTKKEMMIQMLKDVLDQFGPDPKTYRCIAKNGNCLYNPPKGSLSAGCAIGMYIINTSTAKKMDKQGSIPYVSRNLLPKWMQKVDINFLTDIQDLHDTTNNWNTIGLSEYGKNSVRSIADHYDLKNFKHKYLN